MYRAFLLSALLLLCAAACEASAFSYLYIQGDKQTPFYVKIEDAMQPRYGKNYCIVPQLAAGETHIEILFQQNTFPAQQFTVNMPEGGSRGFLLVKRDAGFSLYDLQSGAYLPAGNKSGEEAAAATTSDTSSAKSADIAVTKPKAPEDGPSANVPPAVTSAPIEPAAEKTEVPVKEASAQQAKPGDPVFIKGMELGNRSSAALPIKKDTSTEPAASAASGLPAIANTDCPAPIRPEEFSDIFKATNAQEGDEERVAYLSEQLNHCYASWMARALAMRLQSNAARFSLLKKIYPRITDQAAFPLLDDLFTTDVWKTEFAKLVHH